MNSTVLGFLTFLVICLAVAGSLVAKKLSALRDPLKIWDALNNVGILPIRMRAWIFSTIVGVANPYSRSINFRITELRKGKACGVMKVEYPYPRLMVYDWFCAILSNIDNRFSLLHFTACT